MRKKQIPIEILKALKNFVNLKGNKFDVIEPGNFLLKIIDKDPKSNFYFIAEQYQYQNNEFKLLINFKPKSEFEINSHRAWIHTKNLEANFSSWLSILNEYDSVPSFFDDPILKSYQEEYFSEFELIEDDAENVPFTTKQILILDEHLENIENNIDQFKNEENQERINEIKEDVDNVRKNLTKKDKFWIVENLTKIWAKLTKEGTQFMKEFLSATRKEIIKESVKTIHKASKIIVNNPNILN